MTQDDIIRMAREAGAAYSEGLVYFEQSDLQRFANLVAAHKAEVTTAEAAAKALYETWHSQLEYKPWQDGGNSHKQDEARELVRLAAHHKLKPPLPVQDPVAWTTMPEADDWDFVSGNKDPTGKLEGKWFPLYTAPPQRKPLTDDVLVPLEVLEAAANSLDSFCGDLGWGDADLQNMDNLFAVIEQHKAAHNIKEGT